MPRCKSHFERISHVFVEDDHHGRSPAISDNHCVQVGQPHVHLVLALPLQPLDVEVFHRAHVIVLGLTEVKVCQAGLQGTPHDSYNL